MFVAVDSAVRPAQWKGQLLDDVKKLHASVLSAKESFKTRNLPVGGLSWRPGSCLSSAFVTALSNHSNISIICNTNLL